MTTALTLCLVIGVGLLFGGFLSRNAPALVAIGGAGTAVMIAVFVEYAVLPNPGGDGWADRYEVSGHRVPVWQCNLIEASVLGWLAAIAAASSLVRLGRRRGVPVGRHS